MALHVHGSDLSPQQKRLWLIEKKFGQVFSNGRIEIAGPLNRDTLVEALRHVTDKYEILRTSRVATGDGFPLQRVDDVPTHRLKFAEKTYGAAPHPPAEEAPAGAGDAVQYTLLRQSAEKHALLIQAPAAALDFHSLNILLGEIALRYDAGEKKETSGPAREDLPYRQYAEWQNENIALAEENEVDYWKQLDPSGLFNFRLPGENLGDAPHKWVDTDTVSFCIPAPEARDLLGRLAEQGTAAEDFFLTCWAVLLHRFSGSQRPAFGCIDNHREHAVLGKGVGLYAKLLPVACEMDPADRFSDCLRQVGGAYREAREWKDYYVLARHDCTLTPTEDPMLVPYVFEYRNFAP
ncbi:MAG: hypothetical protein ICV83_34230, partial [Cytophagales bacterium]|nr:hypothetical protein [Cytophagales bacterium]